MKSLFVQRQDIEHATEEQAESPVKVVCSVFRCFELCFEFS